ncbi:hypothetical protein HPB52_018370 [Rhipicephalus sanguineus]|uniref:Uncharacterized protein n=1 Tax=Rhipicephalus sanguineus TaxID=34632 RepID=A0A9D4PX39_RHISA|nr:hypothetical protein HPB52_018370 [Rhipicephalus sanguineus]
MSADDIDTTASLTSQPLQLRVAPTSRVQRMSDGEDYGVLPTDQWKGQLVFDKPCGAASSKGTCWLLDDLKAWNLVTLGLAFELVETTPGTLLLRHMTNVEVDRDPEIAAREASFLVSWLLRHHPCIQELDVKSPEQIWLPETGQLSLQTLSVLFNALASNKRVSSLTVDVKHDPDAKVALLCEVLKKNRYIKLLCIEIENGESANEILHALTVNAAVAEVDMTLRVAATEETMAAFSDMLSGNNSITSISAILHVDQPGQFMDSVAQGMSSNRLIVNFKCWAGNHTRVPSDVFESVRRNKSALNRAVEFVLQRREDRHSAECFELFSGRSCLTSHLTEVAGMSDDEARLEEASAELRLREKYFVLTGIVRRSVICWKDDVTQIDALNPDCWRAIASYLRITDASGAYR